MSYPKLKPGARLVRRANCVTILELYSGVSVRCMPFEGHVLAMCATGSRR